ncbi:MAG: hypothetical protein J6S14_04200, partial [Clostridia bacterium]|nr:hypothetical protein [Clostridia bacterium]
PVYYITIERKNQYLFRIFLKFFLIFLIFYAIISSNKRINTVHWGNFTPLSDDFSFGDKETAVKIRGNSHYR